MRPPAYVLAAFVLAGCAVGRGESDGDTATVDPDASTAMDAAADEGPLEQDTYVPPDIAIVNDTGPAMDVTPVTDVPRPDVPVAMDTAMPCTPTVTVNEVQTGGTVSAGDEFVELYNAGACPQSLTGWTLDYASATGSTPAARWTGGTNDRIEAHGFFVVTSGGSSGHSDGMFNSATGTLAGSGGGIGVFDATGLRVDSVGYGPASNALVEGAAAVAPAPGQSIARMPDGHDTDMNATDFHMASAPTPGAGNR